MSRSGSPATRLDRVFAPRDGDGLRRKALMPFITGGFPTLEDTARLIPSIVQAGADAIEIGFPFSDPIADGPVIAQSMAHALGKGTTPEAIFEVVQALRPGVSAGLLAMVSVSIVERMGVERFIERAALVGFDGLIVPDLDLDDAGGYRDRCAGHSLAFSVLAGPSSSARRLERLAAISSGFLYVLARVGLTGERGALPPDLPERVRLLRTITDLPLAVGFGISDAGQVRGVLEHADAAIVGSALVRRIADAVREGNDAATSAAAFVAELAAAVPDGRASVAAAGTPTARGQAAASEQIW